MIRITSRFSLSIAFASAFTMLAIIVYLSLTHDVVEVPGDSNGRYSHVAAYGALMFICARLCATTRGRLLIGVLLVVLGVSLEYLQAMTTYRTFEYGDMVANAIGVALGAFMQRTASVMATARQAP